MTWTSNARFIKLAVAAIAVLAWLTATNHCLLGVVNNLADHAPAACHCHDDSQTTSHPGNGTMLACCQGLQSTNSEFAKLVVTFHPVLTAIRLFVLTDPVRLQAQKQILLLIDTGPPFASPFIETVLRRSQPQNAPPLAA